jgi:hypothetical protein
MSIISAEEFCDVAQLDQQNVSSLMVDMVVGAAQERIEDYCGREFEQATHTEYHDVADRSTTFVYVRNPPIDGVTSLQYDAQSDDPETVDAGDYVTDATAGKVTLYDDESYFPHDDPQGEQAIKIVYTGGYTAADMPDAVKLAVAQLALHYWDNPDRIGKTSESVDGASANYEDYADIPQPIAALLAPHRRMVV